jgi:hypothetical protein
MDWIHLTHYRDQWRAPVNMVNNLRFHKMLRKLLCIWVIVRFSRRTRFHEVSSLVSCLVLHCCISFNVNTPMSTWAVQYLTKMGAIALSGPTRNTYRSKLFALVSTDPTTLVRSHCHS